ncbi:MAG: FAD-binding oxidoreductase [Acidobacteriota bacterium]|nr:FAD-binding oxidoreductase [Acidobacteriota bacterium]
MLKVRTEPEFIGEFVTDESGIFQASGVSAIWCPETETDVIEALRLANQQGILVTTSGGGTGITGGRVAVHGGVVLSTRDMREPLPREAERLEIERFGATYAVYVDRERKEAWVPAGMPLELLADLLPAPLFYPPDPTEKTALAGSTVATNASGARTFHYGPTRDWVLGLRVVLPNGDLVVAERDQVKADGLSLRFSSQSGTEYEIALPNYKMPSVKNAAGLYAARGMDLVDLFIGSEGILGVISEVHVRLAEKPEELVGQIAFFQTEDDALGFVDDMRAAARAGTPVLSIEYFDANSIDFMQYEPTAGKGYCAVYVEVAGTLDDLASLIVALEEHNCVHDWFAETERDAKEQKEFRHSLPEGVNSYLRQHGSRKLGTDMVVPSDRFREMLALYREAGEQMAREFPRDGSHALMFGHIGNDHLHVNFVTHSPEELERAEELYGELAKKAVAFGGTISGEHGVGKKTILVDGRRIPYLEVMVGREGLLEIARAKKVLDPGLILDVGNMVPADYLAEA